MDLGVLSEIFQDISYVIKRLSLQGICSIFKDTRTTFIFAHLGV